MTDRKPYEIEREIEAERTALQRSLDALHAQFSPEAIVTHSTDYLRRHGGDLAQSLGRTAKENPVPLALTAIGIAWMMMNGRGGHRQVEYHGSHADREDVPRVTFDHRSRPTAEGFAPGDGRDHDFDERVRAADAGMRGSARTGSSYGSDESASTYAAGSATGNGATSHQKNGGKTMSERMKETWSSAKVRAYGARDRAYRSAADLRARIEEGTHDLPAHARNRIREARAAAISAQEQVEARAAEMARRARQASYDNPLIVGAIAFAAGAALGAALPRTSVENRYIGHQRDQLFDEAERVFREETAKAKRVAETVVAEGQTMVKEAISDATSSGKSATSRLSETAKSEANKQRLGDVS